MGGGGGNADPPPGQPNLLCPLLLLLYPDARALHSPAFSATEFSGVVLLVFDTPGCAEPSLSPLPDIYPNLVIFRCFLVALT